MKIAGPDPIDVTVGLRIRLRRKALGLTQGALAEALGLSFQQVQKYERGANRVSASMLVRAARFLDCTVAHLVDDQGETPAARDVADLMSPGALEAARAFLAIRATRRPAVLNLLRALSERFDADADVAAPGLDGEPQAELRVN